jgi:ADP-glucose pyrophosphorylase
MLKNTIAIILGGGRGTRLFPLTKDRSKPAVPIAGKYRLVDIPISNCLNSGIRKIYVLTQFNSASLNRHIKNTYNFDNFSNAFVDILAAEQTPKSTHWFQGTADAVRQSLHHLQNYDHEYVLILSGDQLYQMDYEKMMQLS